MAKVEVGKGRATINQLSQGMEVIIPAKRNYFIIIFLSCWLVGWSIGEVSAIKQIITSEHFEEELFLFVWVTMWTMGGGFALIALLWNLRGKEKVSIDDFELRHVRDFVLFKRSKEYDLVHIEDLRSQPNVTSQMFGMNSGIDFWGFTGGNIVFDYGKSTHKFGGGLDEAEAKHIISEIKQRYKNI